MGQTPKMDLPFSKNDITNNLGPQKPVVYSRNLPFTLFLRWVEMSLRKLQLLGFAKQLRIYSCQPAIPALPPVVIHSVMTVFRRL